METIVLQKTARMLPAFPYPVGGNFKLEDFKRYYDFKMYEPAKDLAPFVAYYSIFEPKVLPGEALEFTQILQVPAASIMFSRKKSALYGVTTKRIQHRAHIGDTKIRITFKPAGLRAFCPALGMSKLVDQSVSVSTYFPQYSENFLDRLLEDGNITSELDSFLRIHQPRADQNIELVNTIIKSLDEDDSLTTTRQIIDKYKKGERSMQELFRSYVGVSLKWAITRSRLIKVMQSTENPEEISWVQLAAELGYSNQSHLINDFKAHLGHSPANFVFLKTQ